MFYNIYLIDEHYVGITLKDPQQRLLEHVIQAVKNHATRKDKHIFAQLVKGQFPKVEHLFTSTWSDEDMALTRAAHPKDNPLKRLAGYDEEAVCIYFRDVIAYDLLNIAAGTTLKALNRAIVIGKTSAAFGKWLDSRNPTFRPQLLPKSQVKAKAKNSVTYDDQETLMVVTPTRIAYEDHALSGPNTRIIYYRWDNSNQDPRQERFVDTYNKCGDMMVGTSYRLFTEKWLAPDDPENTKCWSWAAHEVFDYANVKRSLEDRLERIEQLPDRLRDWEDMYTLEVATRTTLRHLIELHAEREGKPFSTTTLLKFLYD